MISKYPLTRMVQLEFGPGWRRKAKEMSKYPIKSMLIIQDHSEDAGLLRELLSERGWHKAVVTHVECMRDAEKYLALRNFDFVLLDLALPDAQGLEAVRRVRDAAPHAPLVVLTGVDD